MACNNSTHINDIIPKLLIDNEMNQPIVYRHIKRVYHAAVKRRKQWKKFGDCHKLPSGPETGITTVSNDIVRFESVGQKKVKSKPTGIWRPKASLETKSNDQQVSTRQSAAYRPPVANAATSPYKQNTTIKISNLNNEVTKEILKELCSQFGKLLRVNIIYDHYRQVSRGYGFIKYRYRDDAEQALETLDGYRYYSMILSAQWADDQTSKTKL